MADRLSGSVYASPELLARNTDTQSKFIAVGTSSEVELRSDSDPTQCASKAIESGIEVIADSNDLQFSRSWSIKRE